MNSCTITVLYYYFHYCYYILDQTATNHCTADIAVLTKGSRNKTKITKVVTMSLEGGPPVSASDSLGRGRGGVIIHNKYQDPKHP